jgi:hypothetical protein
MHSDGDMHFIVFLTWSIISGSHWILKVLNLACINLNLAKFSTKFSTRD